MIHTVETAARLLELPAATLHAGDVAQVLGRLVPGDGSWLYRWDPNSTAGPNGGTVLAPAGMPAAGRWLLCHSGTVGCALLRRIRPGRPGRRRAGRADGGRERNAHRIRHRCEFHTPPHVHTRARHAGFHRPHSNGTGRGARKAQRSLRRAVSLYGRAGG